LPIESGKGFSLTYDGYHPPLRTPLILSDVHLAVTPLPVGLRLAGTLELGRSDDTIAPRRLAALRRGAAVHLEDLDAERVAVAWQGKRPCTPDGLPLLGLAPGFENLWVATGHAMLGVSLAPVTALLAAQLVCGQPTALDVGPLDPARFAI
jgi:D-amino-acid dehydrogenase